MPSRPANDLGEDEENEDDEDIMIVSKVQLFQKRFSCGGGVGRN